MSSVQIIYHVGFYALIIRGYCFGDLVKTKWDIVVLCSVLGKISVQPHTIVKQICFLNGNVLF